MEIHDLVAGLAIAIGLVGIVVVLVPGLPLVAIAVVLWAYEEGGSLAMTVAVFAVAAAIAITILKYQRPGRRLREAGISRSQLLIAVLLGVIGFFVIPVIGGPLGFVAGIYLVQQRQGDREQANRATRNALKAIALSIGIELAGGFAIAAAWLLAVWLG